MNKNKLFITVKYLTFLIAIILIARVIFFAGIDNTNAWWFSIMTGFILFVVGSILIENWWEWVND